MPILHFKPSNSVTDWESLKIATSRTDSQWMSMLERWMEQHNVKMIPKHGIRVFEVRCGLKKGSYTVRYPIWADREWVMRKAVWLMNDGMVICRQLKIEGSIVVYEREHPDFIRYRIVGERVVYAHPCH